VRERRDREQVLTAIRARALTGLDTLRIGLMLSNTALKVAGDKKHE